MFGWFSVMEMGFTEQEARLGLRFSRGNIQLAVAHISEQREVNILHFSHHHNHLLF